MNLSTEFATLIRDASDGTLPWPRIEAELQGALADPTIVLLRGEPGSGKTCLVARALRERGGLHHFLRRGHAESTLWRDPHAFLLSIGFQLKARHGDALFSGSVAIDVQQTLHELDEGGSLVGVRVERLIASPFAPVQVHVQQQVDRAGGAVAAVTVGELVDEVHRIPLPVFREIALLAPLRRLRQRAPDTRVVLWIDALDEEAGTSDGIGALLPTADELSALGNLTAVIASRPGPGLQRLVDGGARVVDLADTRFDADRRAFADAIVARETADPAVQTALAAVGIDAKALVAMGDGNPMVLAQAFAALRRGEGPSLVAGGLPQGLDAIHVRLAGGLARRAGFAERIAPLLTVLSVARRPLSRDELARFAGLSSTELRQGIDDLAPFLDPRADGEALYHRSFQETLIASAHRDEPWSVIPVSAHDRIASAYLPNLAGPLEGLDGYGLDYLASHLAAGSDASRRRLLDLPDRAWWRLRRDRAGSLWPLLGDLHLAIQVAQSMPPSQSLPAAARLAIIAGRVHDAERSLPDRLAGVAVHAGYLQRALDSMSPEMQVGDRVARLTEIAAALAALPRGDGARLGALAQQVLRQALAQVAHEPDGWTLAKLLEACPPDAAQAMADWVDEAGELARALPADWKRPRAIGAVARLQAAIDAERGRAWFRAALKDCADQLGPSRSLEEARLASAWLVFDPNAASELLKQLRFTSDAKSVETALAIGSVMGAHGHAGALADLARQVAAMLEGFADPYERALGEAALGRAWVKVGELDAARAALQRSDNAAQRLGGGDDPARALQNRPSMAADTVLAIAGLAVDLGAADDAERLEQAWTAFTATGFHNGDAAELVALQRRVEPALLEVQLGLVGGAARRLQVRLAALPALFASDDVADRALAKAWYAQALREAEDAADPGSAPGYLEHAALTAAPAAQIDAALARAKASLRNEDCIALRLALEPRVPPARAVDWLVETVRLWAEACDSIHEVFALPGRLIELPVALADALLARPVPPAPPCRAVLLELALGALAERFEAARGRARFDAALAAIDAAATRELPAAALQAFASGAWWRFDPRRAASLWHSALLWLNRTPAFATNAMHRHTWLMILANALACTNADAALGILLANPEPEPEPNTLLFTTPGPGVDPRQQTGMSPRDLRLAILLARAGLATTDLEPPELRAVALVASSSPSPTARLAQLKAALDAASTVDPFSLRTLLQAQAVRGLSAMGAHRLAGERTAAVLDEVRRVLPVFGTIPMAGHAAALGELAAAALVSGDSARAAELVFEARRLGAEGVDRALASLCASLVAVDEATWVALLAECDRAWTR